MMKVPPGAGAWKFITSLLCGGAVIVAPFGILVTASASGIVISDSDKKLTAQSRLKYMFLIKDTSCLGRV
jgi:hypothetical protein